MNNITSLTFAILDYPEAQKAATEGLRDLFTTASQLSQTSGGPAIEVELVSPDSLTSQSGFAAIVLPPSLGDFAKTGQTDAIENWLRAHYGKGTLICSICAGAFLLARTGLLNHREATTHWALAEDFATHYPDVLLRVDKLVIEAPDLITAGGLMAWTDLGLRLIDRFAGSSIMLETARFFLIDTGEREQSYYSRFTPSLKHGDQNILKLQQWLQTQTRSSVPVTEMARKAGLSDRTLLRRLHKATGHNPSEYLQHLRMNEARDLLLESNSSVDDISWSVGYQDPSAFRRTFHRIVGLTPREFRKRFATGRGSN
ncbi:GlxA family transcriptional regulator [Kiloniella sp. b19]|uniref:GlxA family transcriptional regulator n=1 Tax=Kiloniella sp. GXU_MW_B19 TaxID=3141326 RepID=UPI0031D2E74B